MYVAQWLKPIKTVEHYNHHLNQTETSRCLISDMCIGINVSEWYFNGSLDTFLPWVEEESELFYLHLYLTIIQLFSWSLTNPLNIRNILRPNSDIRV